MCVCSVNGVVASLDGASFGMGGCGGVVARVSLGCNRVDAWMNEQENVIVRIVGCVVDVGCGVGWLAKACVLATDDVRCCWLPCVLWCAALGLLVMTLAALMTVGCKLLSKGYLQGAGLFCRLGAYYVCSQGASCEVHDGCCRYWLLM